MTETPAGLGRLCAVLQFQRRFCVRRPLVHQRAVSHCQFQRQQLAARLGDVDINGIERLDRGKRGSLLGSDQCALSHSGASDAAGDRCGYACVIEIDARTFGVGERLPVGRARVVIVLRRYRGLLQ